MVNLICGSIVFCIASTIRIFWVISLTLLWGFKKKNKSITCLVFNELYSGGLMTFRCLSMLTASGRRVSPFFFFSAALSMTWEGNGGKWGVFAIRRSFREQTVKRPHKIWSIAIQYGRGNVSTNEIYGFIFHASFFWFGQCLCDALIPLGYDSDLQRICIIKLVEKFMRYTSMGGFFIGTMQLY